MISGRYQDMAAGEGHDVQESENMLGGENEVRQWS
jgi:hypothetical protein